MVIQPMRERTKLSEPAGGNDGEVMRRGCFWPGVVDPGGGARLFDANDVEGLWDIVARNVTHKSVSDFR